MVSTCEKSSATDQDHELTIGNLLLFHDSHYDLWCRLTNDSWLTYDICRVDECHWVLDQWLRYQQLNHPLVGVPLVEPHGRCRPGAAGPIRSRFALQRWSCDSAEAALGSDQASMVILMVKGHSSFGWWMVTDHLDGVMTRKLFLMSIHAQFCWCWSEIGPSWLTQTLLNTWLLIILIINSLRHDSSVMISERTVNYVQLQLWVNHQENHK